MAFEQPIVSILAMNSCVGRILFSEDHSTEDENGSAMSKNITPLRQS